MDKPSTNEMQQEWLHVYAWQSFRLAYDATQLLLQIGPNADPENVTQKCAVTALYTAYCRPFGNNYGAGQLQIDLVPEDRRELHEKMFAYRDKAIAHKDNDQANPIATAVNQVHFIVFDGRHAVSPLIHVPPPDELREIQALCSILVEKTEYYMRKFGKKFILPLKLSEGRYRLNASAEQGDWLIKIG